MPIYQTTPKENIISLINQVNPSIAVPIADENIYFGIPRLDPANNDGMSTILPAVGQLNSEYYGYQDFKYKRINLSTAFDTIPIMSAVGASTIYGMLPTINQFLGLNLQQSDILNANISYIDVGAAVLLNIQAVPGSLGYTGSMKLQFNRIQPTMEQVIRNLDLNVMTEDISPSLDKTDIAMQMWNVDFTPFTNSLTVTSSGTWSNPSAIEQAIEQEFGYTDWPTAPAKTVVKYPTSSYPQANPNFDYVIVQTNVNGASYAGTALFHYNLS